MIRSVTVSIVTGSLQVQRIPNEKCSTRTTSSVPSNAVTVGCLLFQSPIHSSVVKVLQVWQKKSDDA